MRILRAIVLHLISAAFVVAAARVPSDPFTQRFLLAGALGAFALAWLAPDVLPDPGPDPGDK